MSVDLPAVPPLEVGWVDEGTVAFPPTELGRLGRLRMVAAIVVWDRRSDRGRGVAAAAAAARFDSVEGRGTSQHSFCARASMSW